MDGAWTAIRPDWRNGQGPGPWVACHPGPARPSLCGGASAASIERAARLAAASQSIAPGRAVNAGSAGAATMRGMRSLLGFLVTAAVALAVLWFGLPIAASGIVTATAVAAGLDGTTTRANVLADPPLAVLFGHADRVTITSSNDTLRGVGIASLDLTLSGVGLLDRSAEAIEGTLSGIRATADATSLRIDRATLSGNPAAARLVLLVMPDDVAAALQARLTSAGGGTVGSVAGRPPDAVTALVDGHDVTFTLSVEADGSLVARPPGGILGPVVLWAPGTGLPATLDGVSVGADGIRVTGTLDAATLLGLGSSASSTAP